MFKTSTIKDKKALAALRLAAHCTTLTEQSGHDIACGVLALQKVAASLHKRYEAECSYPWADTDKYRRATLKLEEKAVGIAERLGLELELQTDPRGWPLILSSGSGTRDDQFTIRLG